MQQFAACLTISPWCQPPVLFDYSLLIFTLINPMPSYSTSTAGRRSPSLAGWIGWLGISIFLCDTVLSVSTGWIDCWASCGSSSIERPPLCAFCLVDRVCFWHFFSFPVYRSVLSFTNSEVLESAIQFLIIWSSINFDGIDGLYDCCFRSDCCYWKMQNWRSSTFSE